jgi:hypothetical protein
MLNRLSIVTSTQEQVRSELLHTAQSGILELTQGPFMNYRQIVRTDAYVDVWHSRDSHTR